jgi:hypothetical protein
MGVVGASPGQPLDLEIPIGLSVGPRIKSAPWRKGSTFECQNAPRAS